MLEKVWTEVNPPTLLVYIATPLWRTVSIFFKNLRIVVPNDPEVLLLAIYSEKNTVWKDTDQIRSDQSLSRVRLFETPWIAARQASLSITNSQSSLRLTSIESVMPSSLCCPLHLLPLIYLSIRVFPNESALCIRWPEYWSFSANSLLQV